MLAWNGKPLFDAGKFYKVRFIKYITVDPSLHGSVNLSRYSGEPGDVITAFAVPDQHYTFDSYDITGAELTGSRFTIGNDNIHIQGNFVPKVYSVSYYNDGHGTLAGSLTTATANMTGTLTATPNSHYLFGNYAVTGGSIIGDRLTVTGNCSAKVYFAAEPKYNITLSQQVGGSVSADKTTAYSGDIVNLSNTPSAHYDFMNYSLTGAVLTGSQFRMSNQNVTARANFSAWPVRNLTLSQQTGGTIGANKTTGYDGDTVALSNTANAGYSFNSYSITGATLTGNNFKFNDGDVTAKSNFTHNVYNITLSQQTGGTLSANKTTGYYNDTITLSNTASAGYTFNNYSLTGGTLTGSQFKIQESNATAKANFTHNVYNITLSQKTGGTITANKTTGYYGDTITLSNTANTGYTFNNYSITGGVLTGNQFKLTGSNVTATPNFTHNVYTITLSQQTGGTISANKTTGYYNDTVTLSNTADAGYTFNSYSITGGVLTGNQFKITGSDVTVKPNYTHNVYNLTLQQQTGGTISANKSTGYYNDTVTLSNAPSALYTFANYSITGATLTGSQFKFNNSNVTAKANFNYNLNVLDTGNNTARAFTARSIKAPLNNDKYFGYKYTFRLNASDYYPAETENSIKMSGTYYSAGYNRSHTATLLYNDLAGLVVNDYTRYPYANAGVIIFSPGSLSYQVKEGSQWVTKSTPFYPNTSNTSIYSAYNSAINPYPSTYGNYKYWLYKKNYENNDITIKYIFEETSNGRDNVYVYAGNQYAGSSYTDHRKDLMLSEYWKTIEYFDCGAAREASTQAKTSSSGHISWTAFTTTSLNDAIAV